MWETQTELLPGAFAVAIWGENIQVKVTDFPLSISDVLHFQINKIHLEGERAAGSFPQLPTPTAVNSGPGAKNSHLGLPCGWH